MDITEEILEPARNTSYEDQIKLHQKNLKILYPEFFSVRLKMFELENEIKRQEDLINSVSFDMKGRR